MFQFLFFTLLERVFVRVKSAWRVCTGWTDGSGKEEGNPVDTTRMETNIAGLTAEMENTYAGFPRK